MPPPQPSPPAVFVVSGLDPSGGAGLLTDTRVLSLLGCHPGGLVTTLTVQNSERVFAQHPVPVSVLDSQWQHLMQDISPVAVKAGALGNAEIVRWLGEKFAASAAAAFRVVDPVLSAGGGGSLSAEGQITALRSRLLPHTDLLTPNHIELERLTGIRNEDLAVANLFAEGVRHILVTGGHAPGEFITNRLYSADEKRQPHLVQEWKLPRLAGEFHGTGCALSSAITAFKARNFTLEDAVDRAQRWLHQRLLQAYRPGRRPDKGQLFLNCLQTAEAIGEDQ